MAFCLLGACSFRKEPPPKDILVVNKSNFQENQQEDLSQIFEKNTDDFLIKKFQPVNIKDLEKISTPQNDSLLDLAVVHRKDGFLKMILEKTSIHFFTQIKQAL